MFLHLPRIIALLCLIFHQYGNYWLKWIQNPFFFGHSEICTATKIEFRLIKTCFPTYFDLSSILHQITIYNSNLLKKTSFSGITYSNLGFNHSPSRRFYSVYMFFPCAFIYFNNPVSSITILFWFCCYSGEQQPFSNRQQLCPQRAAPP